jgi:hypothetical protein
MDYSIVSGFREKFFHEMSVDIWVVSHDGRVLIKTPINTNKEVDTNDLTINARDLKKAIKSFEYSFNIRLLRRNLEHVLSQKISIRAKKYMIEKEYIYYTSLTEERKLAKIPGWEFISYQYIHESVVDLYQGKTDHFYEVFYAFLDHIYQIFQ